MGVRVENLTIESARELVSNRALWPLVRDFLWDFAPQVHPSWLEGIDALKYPENPRVKRYILDSLSVEPCFHAFPKEDGSRVLLLAGETLESVAKWLGALVCADALRRVTDGETVRRLKAEFPGIYPEVFGYTAYFKDLVARGAVEPRNEDIVVEVAGNGHGLMFSAFARLPEAVVSRAKLKLDKGISVSSPSRELDLPVILKLLKLKFPEAYRLCCS